MAKIFNNAIAEQVPGDVVLGSLVYLPNKKIKRRCSAQNRTVGKSSQFKHCLLVLYAEF